MPPRGDAPAASYSPDGRQIVLLTNLNQLAHPTLCCWDLYLMNADGSDQTRLTFSPGQDSFPRWQPGG